MAFTRTIFHNAAPPSSNTNTGVGGRGHPKAIARTKREWQQTWGALLLADGAPRGCHRVGVSPRLQFATKGRRDADNFYFPIAKPLGDALVAGGILLDDDYERFLCERVAIEVGVTDLPRGVRGRTTLEITFETQPPPMRPL